MEVKLHTKIKHLILAYYYGIFQKMFKYRDRPPYSWYYADLFSGDGICVCEKIEKHIFDLLPKGHEREWIPPFFSLMEYAKPSKFPLKCYFNDKDQKCVDKLKKRLEPYKGFIEKIGNEDANGWHKVVLQSLGRTNKPGIFFLDPANHSDLKFSTIKEISEFKNDKTGHMPELIINLMSFSMLKAIQRGKEKDHQSITESLGTEKWKESLSEYQKRQKTHELFRDIFLEQIQSLGYHTTYYDIASVTGAPLYYLIFATSNERGFMIHKKMESNIKDLQKEKWVKEIVKINFLIDTLPKEQQRLKLG